MIDEEILAVPECKQLVATVRKLQNSKHKRPALVREHPEFFATRSLMTVSIISCVLVFLGFYGYIWIYTDDVTSVFIYDKRKGLVYLLIHLNELLHYSMAHFKACVSSREF